MQALALLSLPRKRSYAVLALVFTLHAVLGAMVGLSVDEAHYLLYALHPALSYFDHPPLVGWVQWPLVAINAPVVVLRLVPGLVWLGSAIWVYHLARRLHGGKDARGPTQSAEQAGLWAVVALALAPLLHVLGVGLLPDSLLSFFALALMWQTLELQEPSALQRWKPWWVLGALLGLAGLSKYTAVLPAAAVALCLWRAHGSTVLRNPRPWLAAALALWMVLPVLVWNANHQWISFTYQAKHGAGSEWQVMQVLRFVLVQLLAYGPLLCWGWVGWRQVVSTGYKDMVWFFVIPFAVLAVMSGGGSSLPHWTAPAWVALAPLAGVALVQRVAQGRKWLAGALLLLQGAACAALLGLMVSAGLPLVAASDAEVAPAPNPFADLHGWDAAGARARALAQQYELSSVAVQNWTLASRLGWYARPMPVHVLEDRFDQFDLWAGDLPVGAGSLVVDWSHMPYEIPQGPHGFAHCELLDNQVVKRFGTPVASFRFYMCLGWYGHPQPQLKLPSSP